MGLGMGWMGIWGGPLSKEILARERRKRPAADTWGVRQRVKECDQKPGMFKDHWEPLDHWRATRFLGAPS